jgi:hypothetical protein
LIRMGALKKVLNSDEKERKRERNEGVLFM